MKSQIAVLLLLAASASVAASFSTRCDSQIDRVRQGCTITLAGKIEAGDSDRLRMVLGKKLPSGWRYNDLLLDSMGGDVAEALLLAATVREAMLATTTYEVGAGKYSHRRCVSACFLVWVAGVERSSMSGSSPQGGPFGIGLHRPYFSPAAYQNSPSRVASAQQEMTSKVRDYLKREQVPEQYVDKMIERSSREVYWLHESGDPFALNGRAPWFEEMMIARCGFDPVYEREFQANDVQRTLKGQSTPDREKAAYFTWRQKYNGCEYEVRKAAQQVFQK